MAFVRSYLWLFIVTIMLAAFDSCYVIFNVSPSPLAIVIMQYTMPICFATWVQTDARRRGCTPCFDFGMFVAMIWALTVPWYLIWTRGWRGVALTAMFIGMFLTPYIVATVVYIYLVSMG